MGLAIGAVCHGPSADVATESVGTCATHELLPMHEQFFAVAPDEHTHEPCVAAGVSPTGPVTVAITSSPVGASVTTGSCANGGSTTSSSTYGPSRSLEVACTTSLLVR